jgi:rare lipoprotein A
VLLPAALLAVPGPLACAQTPPGPQEGLAAHYAARFAGRKTASGEPYRPTAMTAAHLTLPLGTVVRVTRIDGDGKRVAGPVTVRINDRGPYGKGLIDLSATAARRLRMFGGVARVRVEVVKLPPPRKKRGRS